jgi:hypothetical protein
VKRVLTLCADDYGQSAAIDRGILRLVAHGRLSMVSCLANGPAWAADAAGLARTGVQAGLHFNLTEGRPLSPVLARLWPQLPDLQTLIVQAHLGRLPLDALRQELQAQWQVFEQALGRPPIHLDGHQHVHHLPQIRGLVLEQLAANPRFKVRHTGRVRGPGYLVKRTLIEGTGGRALGRQLQSLRRQANDTLLGVYDFSEPDYRRLMQGWLQELPRSGGLLFCHPGEPGDGSGDAIGAARARELAYLGGPEFAADLAGADVRLA